MAQLHSEICYKQVIPKPSSGQMNYLIAAAGNPGLLYAKNKLELVFCFNNIKYRLIKDIYETGRT